MQWAAENGLQRAQYKYTIELENSLHSEKLIENKIKCPAHRKVDKKSGASIDESIQQSIQALAIVEASKSLMQRYVHDEEIRLKVTHFFFVFSTTFRLNLNATEASQILTKVSLKNTTLEGACSETITCPSPASKYRSFDGSCNNLVQVNWGRRNTIYRRLLPAQYGNGDS